MRRPKVVNGDLASYERFQQWVNAELLACRLDLDTAAELRKGIAELRQIAHERHTQGELEEMRHIERSILEADKRAQQRAQELRVAAEVKH
jgi:hypothetical protein